jgi:hypothetical protein
MTVGCQRCTAVSRGTRAVGHNEVCRRRISGTMKEPGDPRFEEEVKKIRGSLNGGWELRLDSRW